MISRLKGFVVDFDPGFIVLDVNGVGYHIFCSEKQMKIWSKEISEIIVFVSTRFVNDQINLYGFSSKEDREMFFVLQSVQGVGPKMALSILSCLSKDEMYSAAKNGQSSVFLMASGVGKKIAEKIVMELKSKIPSGFKDIDDQNNVVDVEKDLGSALKNLGYSNDDVKDVMNNVADNFDETLSFSDKMRLSLKYLSGK